MNYLLIYCIGVLFTFWLLIRIVVNHDFTSLISISLIWLITMPLYFLFISYDFIRDKIIEYKTREPYVDPWEEALTDYRTLDEIREQNRTKSIKKPKQFKFGR